MLNLNDLYLFVQVVDHQGFSNASRQLGTPKTTLSKRVAALENDLEVRLIQRTSRRFTVTDIGKDFYRHAAAMIIEAEAAENVVRGRLAEPSGRVRISASVPTAQLLLVPHLSEIALRYPKLRIELEVTDRFVDIVQEGFDLVLRDHFAKLPDSELIQRQLCTEPISLVASRGYLEQFGYPQTPHELFNHQGLLTAATETCWQLENAAGEKIKVSPQPRFTSNEISTLIDAASKNLGITCLPLSCCSKELSAQTLVHLLPEWNAGIVTTTLLMPHRRGLLPSVRALADFLVERFNGASNHQYKQ